MSEEHADLPNQEDNLLARLNNWFTWKFTLAVVLLTLFLSIGNAPEAGLGPAYLFGTLAGATLVASFVKKLYIDKTSD